METKKEIIEEFRKRFPVSDFLRVSIQAEAEDFLGEAIDSLLKEVENWTTKNTACFDGGRWANGVETEDLVNKIKEIKG